MKIGYSRVSKSDQAVSLQYDALKKAGCEKIFCDEMSGATKDRPGLNQALSHLRSGDILVVWKLDRLGRSIKNLIELSTKLNKLEIGFQSITEGIDTSTPSGKFYFHLMASLAQMERDLSIERTIAGLAAARARGRVGGRRRSMTESKVQAARNLLYDGIPPKEVAANLGVSLPTLYRWIPASSLSKDGL